MKSLKLFGLFLLLTPLSNIYAAEIESDKQKLSYAMGIFFGQSITRQEMDIDVPAFMQAVEDMLKGSELKMTRNEMQQILTDFQKQEQEQRDEQASGNKDAGIKYLEENKNKEGVVTTASGLQYKVVREGKGKKPGATSKVEVHYRGTLIDGTEFDSSYARGEPATFGVNQVIKGWQEALQLMPVGSKWQIYIPSDLAYGERGAGGSIGPNSTLVFDVELLDIK